MNGKIRHDRANSQKLIAYIPQEQQLRKFLTVEETMILAAHFKLGFKIGINTKKEKVSKTAAFNPEGGLQWIFWFKT